MKSFKRKWSNISSCSITVKSTKLKVGVFSDFTLPSTRLGLDPNTTCRTWRVPMTSAPTKPLASPWLKLPGNIMCQGKLWKTMWLDVPVSKHFIENLGLRACSFRTNAMTEPLRASLAITKWIILMITPSFNTRFNKWFDYFLCNNLPTRFEIKISAGLVKKS